ncbi:MAG: hypothetical protein IJO54_08150 [Oscillospiraceae bacterium]|nr:hypothetical protein [Oscillospiraceae bacterium]
MIKLILAVFVCTVLTLALAGCDREPLPKDHPANSRPVLPANISIPDGNKNADSESESTEETDSGDLSVLMTPLEEYGLTVENIEWSNMMMYLLNRHSSVKTVKCEDGIKYVEGYIKCNDNTASIFTTIYPDGTMESNGFFDRFIWALEDGRVVARTYIEYLDDEYYTATDSEYVLSYYFMDAEAEVISADNNEYTLYVHNFFNDYIITLDRNTLDIKRVEYDAGEDNPVVVEYIYDELVEGGELFDTWNGEKKHVTVVSDMYYDDSTISITKTFEIASDWELLPDSWEEISLYGNEEYTAPYEYPGFAQDYMVYVTNAKG